MPKLPKLLRIAWLLAFSLPPVLAAGAEQTHDALRTFKGRRIESIDFDGLIRTREVAARWVLLQSPGDILDPELWRESVNNLYNTGSLYDVETEFLPGTTDPAGSVRLRVKVKDKWTLYPYFSFQTGGSVLNYAVGLMDYNLFGNFTEAWAQASVTEGQVSYEVNFFQPWLGRSDLLAGFGLSDTTRSATQVNGTAEAYSWRRIDQSAAFGKRLGLRTQLLLNFDFYRDSMVSQSLGSSIRITDGRQYRLRPVLVLGKISRSNFLEEGSEVGISSGLTNFLSGTGSVYSLSASWKRVIRVRGEDNLAWLLRGAALSEAPLPYQLHLGGFSSIRGFSAYRALGLASASANLEYRPRLLSARTSLFYIDQFVVQGCLFSDMGGILGKTDPMGSGPFDRSRFLASVGAGIRVFFVRYAGALFRIDFAQTVYPSEGWGMSLGVGQFF